MVTTFQTIYFLPYIALLKVPVTARQVISSPPQTPHESRFAVDPNMLSHPTAFDKKLNVLMVLFYFN